MVVKTVSLDFLAYMNYVIFFYLYNCGDNDHFKEI